MIDAHPSRPSTPAAATIVARAARSPQAAASATVDVAPGARR